MTINHTSWAEYLQAAADERREVQGIQSQVHELSIADAYRIQDALIARRLVTGDSLAGAKLGLTSKAKQEQMGVSEPAYGWVTASAVLPERADVRIGELIHPRVEPEFVFLMGQDVFGESCGAFYVLEEF